MIDRKLSNSGFTLVELILYMGLFSLLMTMLVGIFTTILDVSRESEASSAVIRNGKYILTRLSYDLERAQSITTPATAGQQGNSLQIAINSINYTYAPDTNGNLQITNNNGTDNLNDYDASISAVTFQRIGNTGGKDTVRINFTLTGRTTRSSGKEIQTFQTTIGLR